MFIRTLTLQASWNHERMQNLGLLTIMLPWLRGRSADTWTVRQFCRRYYVFFNTNPYLANFLIGGLIRLESEREHGVEVTAGTISMFRDSLGRTLASLGDQLFWLGLRPTMLLAASLAAVFGQFTSVIILIGLFAIFQFGLRWYALKKGFDLGMDIVDLVSHPIWHRSIAITKRAGMLLTGVLAGVYLSRLFTPGPHSKIYLIMLGVLLGVLIPVLARRRMPGEVLLVLSLLGSLLLAFAV